LAGAFVAVAVSAVVVLAVLTLVASRSEVSGLVSQVHRGDAAAAAAAAARAYEAAGGWESADVTSVAAVAARGQATVTVADAAGTVVAAPVDEAAEMMAAMHGVALVDTPRGAPVTAPVVVAGEQVGTVALRFPSSHLPTPEREVRDALARTVAAGGLFAVAAAVGVAVFVARRVTGPVTALTAAAARLEAGERDVTVGMADAPGELGALAAAFDRMSAAVAREDELRRRLLHDVAHEVRTPLTILRATTEGLLDGDLPADQPTLAGLHDEVLRLTRIVGDVEALAAAEAAGLSLATEPLDLADLVAAAADLARPAAADAGLTLEANLGAASTTGDAARLRQVVVNLLANALRYTPPGGTVTVATGCDGNGAWVEVADTGPGLSDEDLTRLFDRFYRGRAAEGTSGSGIGLAVAAELAAAHGGSVTAANRPGGGAVFRLTVPDR
jgi:signal transduction histidine kinase